MDYIILAKVFESLEKEQSYLKKTEILSEFLQKYKDEDLEHIVLLLQGDVFSRYENKELGIGLELIKKSIATSTGYELKDVEKKFKQSGDLGSLVYDLISKKRQSTLFSETLTTKKVFENLRAVYEINGAKSQERKLNLISELLTVATPLEGKFIIRTILGDLRIGIAEGRLKDAISKTFNIDETIIDRAIMLTNDFPYVCSVAAKEGENGLLNISMIFNRPVSPMLAQGSKDLSDILERMPTAAYEYKLDGMRMQIHLSKESTKIFTRRFDDITGAFPDVVSALSETITAESVILDGELVAYSPPK